MRSPDLLLLLRLMVARPSSQTASSTGVVQKTTPLHIPCLMTSVLAVTIAKDEREPVPARWRE